MTASPPGALPSRLLAIDTATENCSAALMLDGRRIAQRCEEIPRGHAERILPMVEDLLREAGVRLQQLQAVAFGRGPGSFTGVRLAASVAQGLAWGAGLPVVPVSSLRAVAQRAFELHPQSARVLVCTDARMHEVYWAGFRRGADGLAEAEGAEGVAPPVAVPQPVPAGGPGAERPLGAGRGFAAYPELLARLAPSLGTVEPQLLPDAAAVLRLGAAEFAAGRALPPAQALPSYVRDDVVRSPGEGRPGT